MTEKMSGLSLDFIIHPGETIKEVLEEKQMNQEELAIRTGFSPKHISEVVNGKKGISPSFAKSLEYVLGMPASFWMNLQGIYDRELLEYKERVEIDEKEISIVRTLKKVIKYAEKLGFINKNESEISQIIELRNICNVNNLTYINKLYTNAVAFRKSSTIETNIYILFVWIRICELNAERNDTTTIDFNEEKLRACIDEIKKCMFLEVNNAIKTLTEIFAKCGIIFQVVENFTGAPVQGFIKKYNNKIILSMTIRGAFADIFWFTLFHEIGHLLNGDIVSNNFIDFADSKSDMENCADEFAKNVLINEEDFKKFITKENITDSDIINFAKMQNVQPFIVVGRIQKEKNNFKLFSKFKVKYKWKI